MSKETTRPIDRLKQAFSQEIKVHMAFLIKRGIQTTMRLNLDHEMFQSKIGEYALNYARYAGIADAFKKEIKTGKLPIKFDEKVNKRGTYPYLEFNYKGITFHIKKVISAGAMPEPSDYRLKACQTNQPDLFKDDVPFVGPLFALVTYVYNKKTGVTNVEMGVPDRNQKCWLGDEVLDLMEGITDFEAKQVEPETKTQEPSVKPKYAQKNKNQEKRKQG